MSLRVFRDDLRVFQETVLVACILMLDVMSDVHYELVVELLKARYRLMVACES